MSEDASSGGRSAASGKLRSGSFAQAVSEKTSHNIVCICAAGVRDALPIPHCFFIEQWCALQQGGIELPAASTFAHASAMTQTRTIETARRTIVNPNIGRCKLAELMRECTQ